ncbi:MAG: hypothetical protein ACE5KQ_06990, partial [Thermoplasmata archaeon]
MTSLLLKTVDSTGCPIGIRRLPCAGFKGVKPPKQSQERDRMEDMIKMMADAPEEERKQMMTDRLKMFAS